jgi:hypothetical protein
VNRFSLPKERENGLRRGGIDGAGIHDYISQGRKRRPYGNRGKMTPGNNQGMESRHERKKLE